MDKNIFNKFSIVIGFLGGFLSELLGGWDVLTHAIVFFVLVDYLTGLAKAFVKKEVSSEVGFNGIFKKILIFFFPFSDLRKNFNDFILFF